jgi:hypothetical protein
MTYLYSIIPACEEARFDVAGLDHEKVRIVACKGLAAVIGGSPLADYRGIERGQAVRYLLAHQHVVEAVQRDHAVLPVKFGTVVPDERRVCDLLTQGEALFGSAIESLSGQVQMEVMVLWRLPEVFASLSEDDAVTQLRARATGEESLENRIAVGKMVHELMERRRLALRGAVITALQEMSRDLVVNANMDDAMVANLALLIDRQDCGLLDERLHALDEEHEGRLNFRRIGPLPPYTFASVEVRVPKFEDVDNARRLLELGERHDRDEVRQAYRRLAGQVHPDICPDNPEANGLVSDLASAYRFLMAYVDSSANGEPTVCSFDRQTVERTLMIALQRHESQA